MNDFNKGAWLQKTSEYMTYIDQHKKNIIVAWAELREALKDIQLLQRENIIDEMNWRIRRHDDSKMSEEEFLPYRQHFYPVNGENTNESDFEQAWRCHYRRNDHHWQYWVADDGTFINYGSVDEKMCAYLEMICDWQAMGYAMGDSAPQYYRTHKDEIRIDPNWIDFIEEILDSLETHMAKKD